MAVEVVLDLEVGHLGRKRQGVHKILPEGVGAVTLLVEDLTDESGNTLQQVRDNLERLSEVLNIRDNRGGASFGVGGRGDGAQGRAVRVGDQQLVRNLNEETGIGGALRDNRHRSGDVRLCGDGAAGVGRDGEVDGGVGEGAGLWGGEEVLDKGREGVELVGGGVPAEKLLAGGGLEGQSEHVLLVIDIDFDLVVGLDVGDGESRADLDLASIFAAGANEGADYAVRVGAVDIAADGMVDDGEDRLEMARLAFQECDRTA